jgi:hypothetical protein
LALSLVLTASLGQAKNDSITLYWPNEQQPALKLIFGRFQQIAVVAGQSTYVSDVTVQNMTGKIVPHANFDVYLMDKNQVRIGDGYLQVSDIQPQQMLKMRFQAACLGTPVTLRLSGKKDLLAAPAAKTVPMRVISVPPGAKLKVDGQDAGATPVMVRFTVGSHQLDLAKTGYAPGTTVVEVGPDELPGGSVTVELGGLSRDTVELRDGTVVQGDVISVSMSSVVVRVDGNDQTYERNRIKRITLVERETVQTPAVVQPAPALPHP